jgi:hypothetical protein
MASFARLGRTVAGTKRPTNGEPGDGRVIRSHNQSNGTLHPSVNSPLAWRCAGLATRNCCSEEDRWSTYYNELAGAFPDRIRVCSFPCLPLLAWRRDARKIHVCGGCLILRRLVVPDLPSVPNPYLFWDLPEIPDHSMSALAGTRGKN